MPPRVAAQLSPGVACCVATLWRDWVELCARYTTAPRVQAIQAHRHGCFYSRPGVIGFSRAPRDAGDPDTAACCRLAMLRREWVYIQAVCA